MRNTTPPIKNDPLRKTVFIFIVNPLKFLYSLKGDFGRIRNDQKGSKALSSSVKMNPLCGCPGIPGDFAMSRCFKH